MVITWYALYGHDPADVTDRVAAQPWYRAKTEPSSEDPNSWPPSTPSTTSSPNASPTPASPPPPDTHIDHPRSHSNRDYDPR
jgi:hypothetical protein